MAEQINYEKFGSSDSRMHLPELAELYVACFSEPPYEQEKPSRSRFKKWFISELKRPGFTLVRAVRAHELLGMAYGFTMLGGDWWPNAIDEPEPHLAQSVKFAVMEWAVRPSARDGGIGHNLMTTLLSNRPEPYATLLVNPQAPACCIYRRWGWQPVGRVRTAHDPMTIMVRELPSSTSPRFTRSPGQDF